METGIGGGRSKKPFIFAGQFITRFVWLFRALHGGRECYNNGAPSGHGVARESKRCRAAKRCGEGASAEPLMVPLDGRLLGNFYTGSIGAHENAFGAR